MMKLILLSSCLLVFCFPVPAQIFPAAKYPQGYFRSPLAIPIRLAANYGELRSNHFHMGLDIRTDHRVDLPVYAAAGGYVARVKVEPEGFGQAIYINHPNGYTTLYAHLNHFFPALAAYVKKQQYRLESWAVTLDIPPGMFPVAKGDLIARSGSTGGSEGPHLHFEIRSTASEVNLNPLLFGLPIPDKTRPVLKLLAVYSADQSIYEQTPKLLPLQVTSSGYGLGGTTLLATSSRRIWFGIHAFDTQSGSANPNGIFEADLWVDGQPVVGFQMDRISYANTRDVNGHIDYKTKATGGPYIQQLVELPGNLGSIYHAVGGNGVIDLQDERVHQVRIDVKDANGNRSALQFAVQYKPADQPPAPLLLPGKMFYPGMLDGVESEDLAFYLGEQALYDSVHISCSSTAATEPAAISRAHRIGATYIPLQDSLLVRIKPTAELVDQRRSKVVMQRLDQDNPEVRAVVWQGGWASAKFRDFGIFQLVEDDQPPRITPMGIRDGANLSGASKIAFLVSDNLGSYKHFRAQLDGKWLMFTNDKERAFIYVFDEHCPAGQHTLEVSVEDEAGNVARQQYTFTR
jgi:hypothetical protein